MHPDDISLYDADLRCLAAAPAIDRGEETFPCELPDGHAGPCAHTEDELDAALAALEFAEHAATHRAMYR